MLTTLMMAAAISCTVYSVHDGDTVSVDCAGTRKKVRIAGIDAPELKQQFGRESRQALADMVFQKKVSVKRTKSDRYGRDLASLKLGDRDVASALVQGGYAWVYDKYPIKSLYPLQREAKDAQRGLWATARPVAPWEWRH